MKEIKEQEVITLTITSLTSEGQGVARADGLAVFVDGALPGETVRARITTVKKNYARAELLTILAPSPDRMMAFCPAAASCGGCQLAHYSYPAQLKYKQRKVEDALRRIGKLEDTAVHPVLGMAEPFKYRNKGQYPVGVRIEGANPKIVAGFYAPGTHEIVPCKECLIQKSDNDRVVQEALQLAERYGLTAYDEKTGQGFLRHILVRAGFATGEIMVVFVTNGTDFPHAGEICRELVYRCPGLESIMQNINTAKTNVILGPETRILRGRIYIEDVLGDLKFRFSAQSFYQVNPAQTEVLYGKALEYAGLTGEETVLDLYCGIGTISLFMAGKAKKVYGIEVVEQAVRDAGVNAEINGINNVEFLAGDAGKVMDELLDQGVRFDVVMLDPPRAGCDRAVLTHIARSGIPRVVYVSCNPASLARDLGILQELGYETLEVQPVDMFPHTVHVESVAKIKGMNLDLRD
ncbi:MAG: 23S rRNA (uracil(1939)-C(5))-methyltransferase RlmD [Bacillota bacterium]